MATRTRFLLVLAFAAGCGAAATTVPFVIPPARAQNVQRWETLCVTKNSMNASRTSEAITQIGNEAGAQGWEPVGVTSGNVTIMTICFKRPRP